MDYKALSSGCISGYRKVDNLIRTMQLQINSEKDIIFEWIPYNQFKDIEEIGEGGFAYERSPKIYIMIILTIIQ